MQQMSNEARAARREYKRNWNARNPEKCREYNRRYWEKQAAMNCSVRHDANTKNPIKGAR